MVQRLKRDIGQTRNIQLQMGRIARNQMFWICSPTQRMLKVLISNVTSNAPRILASDSESILKWKPRYDTIHLWY